MNVFGRAWSGTQRALDRSRRRYPRLDHLWRAVERYNQVLGGRLAAAIAYYGFFAVFALGLVAYWVFGALVEANAEVSAAVADFLLQNLPFLDLAQIQRNSGQVGVVGLVLLALTGIGWVEAIRSSQRFVYRLDQQPGYFGVRQVVDLAVLVGVFLLIGVSVGAVDALRSLLGWLLGEESVAATVASVLLAFVINMVLASALLIAVPRLRMSARRLVAPILVVAVGITLLNTVGRFYVGRFERNPAYTVVAGAVGLLIYLYLLNQLLLFGAALAATSRHGRVVDLTARRAAGTAPPKAVKAAKAVGGQRRTTMIGQVGALVTLELPDDSPAHTMPWIITFGPLGDQDGEWEPVVCGPYERAHALALAETVVADEELMAVVEPLLTLVTVEEIRAELAAAQASADEDVAEYDDFEDLVGGNDVEPQERHVEPSPPPSPDEVRAGMARIASILTTRA
ncbi:inner membrane protein YhjD [Micromonospora sp. Llam0]|nr:inner membrane protein YhjD [Micromonospora sp. Llam0]